jgi:hypothetical protein
MTEYIKLYFTTTSGQVEPSGDGVGEPVSFSLRADLNEIGEWIGLYALAISGYTCSGVDVVPSGTTSLKWQLAPDDEGDPGTPEDYGALLELGEVGNVTPIFFHTRAKATDDEEPVKDETVTLNLSGIVSAE